MIKSPSLKPRCENCKFSLRRRKKGGPQRRLDCVIARHKRVQG